MPSTRTWPDGLAGSSQAGSASVRGVATARASSPRGTGAVRVAGAGPVESRPPAAERRECLVITPPFVRGWRCGRGRRRSRPGRACGDACRDVAHGVRHVGLVVGVERVDRASVVEIGHIQSRCRSGERRGGLPGHDPGWSRKVHNGSKRRARRRVERQQHPWHFPGRDGLERIEVALHGVLAGEQQREHGALHGRGEAQRDREVWRRALGGGGGLGHLWTSLVARGDTPAGSRPPRAGFRRQRRDCGDNGRRR